jgi:hypothetical protein
MDDSSQHSEKISTILAREIYRNSSRDYRASLAAVCRPTTPTDVLIEIGKQIPFLNPEELAPLLVSHPNFTDELLEEIVSNLKIQWWGDDPIECRMGWETLERERAAHLKKVEELSQNL